MAQHLNAGGRAGIIVPEGIIFQSQNAYKELRKKLSGGVFGGGRVAAGGRLQPLFRRQDIDSIAGQGAGEEGRQGSRFSR